MSKSLFSQLNELRTNVAEHPVTFLRLAARLAALGDSSQLDWALSQSSIFNDSLEEDIAEGCRAVYGDLTGDQGEEQGLALIATQDLVCLVKLASDRIPPKAQTVIEALSEAADEASLDSKAVLGMGNFLQEFPIPEALRLNIPMSAAAMRILDMALPD